MLEPLVASRTGGSRRYIQTHKESSTHAMENRSHDSHELLPKPNRTTCRAPVVGKPCPSSASPGTDVLALLLPIYHFPVYFKTFRVSESHSALLRCFWVPHALCVVLALHGDRPRSPFLQDVNALWLLALKVAWSQRLCFAAAVGVEKCRTPSQRRLIEGTRHNRGLDTCIGEPKLTRSWPFLMSPICRFSPYKCRVFLLVLRFNSWRADTR